VLKASARGATKGQHMQRREKPTVRLRVRKETLQQLRTLCEDDLRGAVAGDKGPPPPGGSGLPSHCATC